MKKRTFHRILLTLIITALFIGWGWWQNKQTPVSSAPNRSSGTAQIGGKFQLIDQYGQTFSSETLKGKHSLVFFGFTHCPDICPAGLLTISDMLHQMGDKSSQIQPIFITVDPERDTSEVMHSYISAFHPSYLALTGDKQAVKEVVSAYKVYSSKRNISSDGQHNEYTMDHSGFIYLMDPQGIYITHYPHDITSDDLLKRLRKDLSG